MATSFGTCQCKNSHTTAVLADQSQPNHDLGNGLLYHAPGGRYASRNISHTEVMTPHAMLNSAFPPSRTTYVPETIESDISLMLCHGRTRKYVYSYLTQDPKNNPWQKRRTNLDPKPESLQEIIDIVCDEYSRTVPRISADVMSFYHVGPFLAQQGVSWSFDEGWDTQEAAEYAYNRARNTGAEGYAYCTNQDVDQLIHTGTIYVGFWPRNSGKVAPEDIGHRVFSVFNELGLNPDWNGSTGVRIECTGLRFEITLVADS